MDEIPATNGSLIMKTSLGDLEIELWSKEAPRACRNFLQLGLESFYDNSLIHRIVPGFCIQGGLVTDKEHCGNFPPELHPRLKFTKRGLLGMVNIAQLDNQDLTEQKDHDNFKNIKKKPLYEYNSQFFISLDQMPEMDRKHTLFGRVIGNTIFNLLRIGECEVDSHNRPLFPPKIIGFEILKNPFEDIIPRILITPTPTSASTSTINSTINSTFPIKRHEKAESTTSKRIISKTLLSFDIGKLKNRNEIKKIKSTHEVIKNDPTLSKEEAVRISINDKNKEKLNKNEIDKNEILPSFISTSSSSLIFNQKEIDKHENGNSILEEMKESKASQYESTRKEIEKLQNELLGIKEDGQMIDYGKLEKKDSKDSSFKLANLILSYKKRGKQGKNENGKSATFASSNTEKSVNEINTLLTLNSFRSKLQSLNSLNETGSGSGSGSIETIPEPVLGSIVKLCKLHGLVDCQSCIKNYNVFGNEKNKRMAERKSGENEENLDNSRLMKERDQNGNGNGKLTDEEEEEDWMMHKLVFDKESGYTQIKYDLNNLKVIDPRQREREFGIPATKKEK